MDPLNKAKKLQILAERDIKSNFGLSSEVDVNRVRCKKYFKSFVGKPDNSAILLISFNYTIVQIKMCYNLECINEIMSPFQTRLCVIKSINCMLDV